MKKRYGVKRAKPPRVAKAAEAKALRILRSTPGLSAVLEPGDGPDANVRVHGRRTPVYVKWRQGANAATAWELVNLATRDRRRRLLLVADQTTAEARRILQEHGIGVVDGRGNAHLELPGLLVHLEGRAGGRGQSMTSPTRLRGKAGLVAQALLIEPHRSWHVADVAERSGISVGLAHRVLARLENAGIVEAEGGGPKRIRRVVRLNALLDLWAEEDVVRRTETFAHRLAQTHQQLLGELGRGLGRHGIDYAATASAGAIHLAPFVTAVPVVEVWAESGATDAQLCAAVGAAPVTEGYNILFLQAKDDTPLAFREERAGVWVANRFRIYSDLRQGLRRGREEADHLRREVIGF